TYYENKRIVLPNFCIIRTIESTFQSHFASQNIPGFNNFQTSIICNDMSDTHIEVAKHSISAVKTYHYKSYLKTHPLTYPFILKSINGRSGSEVFLIENNEDYLNSKLKINNEDFVIQAIQSQIGKDLRVFVIGKKIIAAVLRV